MELNLNYKTWLFPLIAIVIGCVLSLLLLELILNAGHYVISKNSDAQTINKNLKQANNQSQTIVFSGDSWTFGSDALPNQGFFHQLSRDPEFKRYELVNLGYPSYNYFQVINKIIDYKTIPSIVVTTGGVNAWHLLGLQEFTTHAKKYLPAEEFQQFKQDYKENNNWLSRLRIYKLYLYLIQSTSPPANSENRLEFDQQEMDKLFGTKKFWQALNKYRKLYPEIQDRIEYTGEFLKNQQSFTLDQIFYFSAVHCGLTAKNLEYTLKKAGLFYPQNLTVLPYEAYENLSIVGKRFNSVLNQSIIFWSLRVLKKWAKINNVAIFIQTYPEIRMPNAGDNTILSNNQIIKKNAKANGFTQIDHNLEKIDWSKVATPYHVDTQGHSYMKNKIHQVLSAYINATSIKPLANTSE